MKRIKSIIASIIILLLACTLLSACSKGPVGFWKVTEAKAGDVLMTEEDAKSMGLSAVGTFKLNKSGDCEIELLGVEYTGEWKEAEDGSITVKYDKERVLTGSINDEGVMSLKDNEGTEYKLSK